VKDIYIDIINKPKLKTLNLNRVKLENFEVTEKLSKAVIRVYSFRNPEVKINSKALKEFRIELLDKTDMDDFVRPSLKQKNLLK